MVNVSGASLPAAAPEAIALSMPDSLGADLARHWLIYKLVGQGRDGWVQNKWNQEEEDKVADLGNN